MITKQIFKTDPIAKLNALLMALSLTACSLVPAGTPTPRTPSAIEIVATPTEIPLELETEVYSTSESLPEEIIPYMDIFSEMAEGDGLEEDELGPILWIKAAQGDGSVNFALRQVAIVTDLTDPDGQPSNPKPVYYIAYKDELGQMQGGYALDKLIEQNEQGISYVMRMLNKESFQNWQNDAQPEDGSYNVRQIISSVSLYEDVSVEQARTMQSEFDSGEQSSTVFIENYPLGISFIQPGQENQQVGADNPPPDLIDRSFWLEIFTGDGTNQASSLKLSAKTPESTPTPTVEPIPELIFDVQLEAQAKQNFSEFFRTNISNIIISYKESTDDRGTPIVRGTYSIQEGEQYSGEYALIVAKLIDNGGNREWIQELGLTKVTQEQIDNARKELYIEEDIDLSNISYKVLPNLNSTDEHPIIYAKDNVTGKIPLATHYDTQTKELEWVTAGLGDLFNSLGVTFGVGLDNRDNKLSQESDTDLLKREFSLIATGDGLEWRYLRPTRTSFSFDRADQAVYFALDNGQILRGHPLVESASSRLPKWLIDKAQIDRSNLEKNKDDSNIRETLRTEYIVLLVDHVATVVNHYKGIISEYTVINEMFTKKGVLGNEFDYDFWLNFIGEDYIKIALNTAKDADPNGILIINDYWTELKNPKSNALYQYVKTLKENQIPIDGVGFQFHVSLLQPGLYKETIKTNLYRFAELGLKIYITELDMFDVRNNDDTTLHSQARIYKDIVEACIEINEEFGEPLCASITTWGYKDNDSWHNSMENQKGTFPLIFDSTLKPKPNYQEIRSFLESRIQ